MKKLVYILFLSIITSSSFAQDRVFAYTYQSNVLNKGAFDLEFHNLLSTGKEGQNSPYIFGQNLNQRIEFEFGLGHNLQTAFYINSELSNTATSTSTEINQELKISFSNEWKLKLSDPVANVIGSGIYEEFEFGGNNVEFETKLLFDNRISKELFAFNIVYKYEIERVINKTNNVATADWAHNGAFELYFGYMHFFKPNFSLGIEAKNNNDIVQGVGRINSVVFAGPAMHINIEKCFILLTTMPQIVNLYKTNIVPGKMDYYYHEAAEFSLLVGYDF